MPTRIDVLDHGFARLVSYMQPAGSHPMPRDGGGTTRVAHEGWTGDLEIVRNARVSFDADWRAGEEEDKDEKLLRRMQRERHTTPFEAMVFTFEIKCPLFVARQWHRHRTWSYNEVSARYTTLPNEYYVPEVDKLGYQSKENKQGRADRMHINAENYRDLIADISATAHAAYNEMADDDLTRELARSVLPVNTYTRYFATVDLHNLKHFLSLRMDSHAQYEIRVYADALAELVEPICPIAMDAFLKAEGFRENE